MVAANILDSTALYEWFISSIYTFHVQLFFICSGYLYQKTTKVNTIKSWGKNTIKKFLALGIPYFTFSIITWGLKSVFSGSVNQQVDGLYQSLFLNPIAPYWYLYCLFLLFLITPTLRDRKTVCIGFNIALFLKILISFIGCDIYAVGIVLTNEIWFVLGMSFAVFDIRRYVRVKASMLIGLCCAIVFLIGSFCMHLAQVQNEFSTFILGMYACIAIVLIFGYLFTINNQIGLLGYLSKYTMPIFLMHTIFAATLRSVLLKVGVSNSTIHVISGLLISFVGPIIAAKIMGKFKWLDVFLYPTKYLKLKERGNA